MTSDKRLRLSKFEGNKQGPLNVSPSGDGNANHNREAAAAAQARSFSSPDAHRPSSTNNDPLISPHHLEPYLLTRWTRLISTFYLRSRYTLKLRKARDNPPPPSSFLALISLSPIFFLLVMVYLSYETAAALCRAARRGAATCRRNRRHTACCHKDYFTTSCQSRLFSPCCCFWLLRAHPKIEISLTPSSLDTTASLPYSLTSAYTSFLPSLDSDKSNNVYYYHHLSFIFFSPILKGFFSYLKLMYTILLS